MSFANVKTPRFLYKSVDLNTHGNTDLRCYLHMYTRDRAVTYTSSDIRNIDNR